MQFLKRLLHLPRFFSRFDLMQVGKTPFTVLLL